MKARLNLTIDETLLAAVKSYAAKHDVSVSQLVEDYFKKLIQQKTKPSLLDFLDGLQRSTNTYPCDFDFQKEYYGERKAKYGY